MCLSGNNVSMRFILSLVLIASFLIQPVSAGSVKTGEVQYYSFPSDMETTVTKWDGDNLNLKVYEIQDPDKSDYPVGVEFIGHVIKRRSGKRFMMDDYVIVQVDQMKFPDGTFKKEKLKFKVKPRRFLKNPRGVGNTVIGATAITLGFTLDALVVGLPVSRGGFAVWNCISGIHERAEGASKLKAGAKGFVAGAFYPLPHLLRKAYNLDELKVGARLTLDSERKGRSIDATVRPVRTLL